MASHSLNRRVRKVVAYPPLSELSELQRREFHEALLESDKFEDLSGKWQAAILKAEESRPKLTSCDRGLMASLWVAGCGERLRRYPRAAPKGLVHRSLASALGCLHVMLQRCFFLDDAVVELVHPLQMGWSEKAVDKLLRTYGPADVVALEEVRRALLRRNSDAEDASARS